MLVSELSGIGQAISRLRDTFDDRNIEITNCNVLLLSLIWPDHRARS